jgi:hypothetical protein
LDYQESTVLNIQTATQVATGDGTTCALLQSGEVKCWGYQGAGAVGNGDWGEFSSLQPESTGITNAIQISMHGQSACALLSDQTVKCWGFNPVLNSPIATPTLVLGLASVTSISSSALHTCALLSDDSKSCWGVNRGLLGNGNSINRLTPASSAPGTLNARCGFGVGVNSTARRNSSCQLSLSGGVDDSYHFMGFTPSLYHLKSSSGTTIAWDSDDISDLNYLYFDGCTFGSGTTIFTLGGTQGQTLSVPFQYSCP